MAISRRAFFTSAFILGSSAIALKHFGVLNHLLCPTSDLLKKFQTVQLSKHIGGYWLAMTNDNTPKARSLLAELKSECIDAYMILKLKTEKDIANSNFEIVDGWVLPTTSVHLSAVMHQHANS